MEQYFAAYPEDLGYTVWIVTDSNEDWFTVNKIVYSFPSPEDGLREPMIEWSLIAFKVPSNNNVKEVAVLIQTVPGEVITILEKMRQPTSIPVAETVTQ